MGFERGLIQLPGPGTQRPVRPVPAKIDYAVSGLGDDAVRSFFVVVIAEPWMLESRANVVFQLGTHLELSSLPNQQAKRRGPSCPE